VTQHAKATLCVTQVTTKEANMHLKKKQKTMHCCGECKGKGTANHHKTELNPQVPPVRNVLTRAQETN
jgi:hypothetical protein